MAEKRVLLYKTNNIQFIIDKPYPHQIETIVRLLLKGVF